MGCRAIPLKNLGHCRAGRKSFGLCLLGLADCIAAKLALVSTIVTFRSDGFQCWIEFAYGGQSHCNLRYTKCVESQGADAGWQYSVDPSRHLRLGRLCRATVAQRRGCWQGGLCKIVHFQSFRLLSASPGFNSSCFRDCTELQNGFKPFLWITITISPDIIYTSKINLPIDIIL